MSTIEEVLYSRIFALLQESIISCVGPVDHSRYLLGDTKGRLLMLFLEFKSTETGTSVPELMGMRLEVLGEVLL